MQNTKILPVDPPNRKILITYKKVDKNTIQADFKLAKSGLNWLEITEDQTLEIKGVTSLEIENLGDEEVIINGLKLLPLPHFDETKNKEIDGSKGFWDLIDRSVTRNSEIFVLPDGTYSDVKLEINFLGQEIEYINAPVSPVLFDETVFTQSPLNAVVSTWSDWSNCELGSQTRTRNIITPASNGGTTPVLVESQNCGIKNAFVFWAKSKLTQNGSLVRFSNGTLEQVKHDYLVPFSLNLMAGTHSADTFYIIGDIEVGTAVYSRADSTVIYNTINGNFVSDTIIFSSSQIPPLGIPPATRVVITVVNGIVTAITNFDNIT